MVPMTQRNGDFINTPLWLLLRSDMATLWLKHRHPELGLRAIIVAVEVLEPPRKLVRHKAKAARVLREDAVYRLGVTSCIVKRNLIGSAGFCS